MNFKAVGSNFSDQTTTFFKLHPYINNCSIRIICAQFTKSVYFIRVVTALIRVYIYIYISMIFLKIA